MHTEKDEMFIARPYYTQLTLKEQLGRISHAYLDVQLLVVKELMDNACDQPERLGGPVGVKFPLRRLRTRRSGPHATDEYGPDGH